MPTAELPSPSAIDSFCSSTKTFMSAVSVVAAMIAEIDTRLISVNKNMPAVSATRPRAEPNSPWPMPW